MVLGVTIFLVAAFVAGSAVVTDSLGTVSSVLIENTLHSGGWAFVLAAPCFVVFSLWLAFSRYGKITLGRDGEEPEFRTGTWVAMMFSAGAGISLMFYGVNEPLSHFADAPPGTGGSAPERMQTAMATTLFHWTLYPWAIYAVVGLAIAYSCFRRGRRQTISAVFTPLIGEKNADGAAGRVLDILALVTALLGTAASLGLGALEIGSGLVQLGWAGDLSTPTLVAVVVVLTMAAAAYAVSSTAMGVERLSNIIKALAALLVAFVFAEGPTVTILNLLPSSVGSFVGDLPRMAARTEVAAGEGVGEWLSSWTVFYWAWWLSWAPLMGMFIARISRGRTVRQFVGGVILVPSVVSLVWFAVFGGTAISLERGGAAVTDQSTAEGQLFAVLHEYPLASVTSLIAMILMAVFFVSNVNAAAIVVETLSQKGVLEPSRGRVAVWGVLTGAVAAIMLLMGGGGSAVVTVLQNLTIPVAVPFTLVMMGMCVALIRDLRSDPLIRLCERGTEAVEAAVVAGHEKYDGEFAIQIRPSEAAAATARQDGDVVTPASGTPARLPRSRVPESIEDREPGRTGRGRGL